MVKFSEHSREWDSMSKTKTHVKNKIIELLLMHGTTRSNDDKYHLDQKQFSIYCRVHRVEKKKQPRL